MFFQDTNYIGQIYIAQSQEDITKLIQDKILTGVLTTGGDGFSFEIRISTEFIIYKRSKAMLFSRWKQYEKYKYDYLKYVRRAIAEQSPSITFTEKAVCISDSRSATDAERATMHNGYIIIADVPRDYAKKLYADFSRYGIPFRDKLLANHTQLLKEIVQFDSRRIISRKPYGCTFEEGVIEVSKLGEGICYFWVLPSGMEDPYDDCSSTVPIEFSRFGMAPLRNLYECYGFAMALVDIYRPIWAEYGEPIISYEPAQRYRENGIHVRFGVRQKKPVLKAW